MAMNLVLRVVSNIMQYIYEKTCERNGIIKIAMWAFWSDNNIIIIMKTFTNENSPLQGIMCCCECGVCP